MLCVVVLATETRRRLAAFCCSVHFVWACFHVFLEGNNRERRERGRGGEGERGRGGEGERGRGGEGERGRGGEEGEGERGRGGEGERRERGRGSLL